MKRGEKTLGDVRKKRDAQVAELDRSLACAQNILTLGHASAVELLVGGMVGTDHVMHNLREALFSIMTARQALGEAVKETRNKEDDK